MNKYVEGRKKSWRTTIAGVVALLAGLATQFGYEQVGTLILGVAAMFGFASARDNNVSSESAGAK